MLTTTAAIQGYTGFSQQSPTLKASWLMQQPLMHVVSKSVRYRISRVMDIPPKSSPYPLHPVALCLGLTLASQLPPRGRRGEVWVEWHVRRPCYARWPPPRQQLYSQVLHGRVSGNIWIAGLCKRGIFLLATMPPTARVWFDESSDLHSITVQLGRLCPDTCCQHCTQTASMLGST